MQCRIREIFEDFKNRDITAEEIGSYECEIVNRCSDRLQSLCMMHIREEVHVSDVDSLSLSEILKTEMKNIKIEETVQATEISN